MTDNTSLVNLALQSFGSRTTITAAQLAAGSNNEAKQANLTFANTRDSLMRLAPWDCCMKTANLVYITSVPGTPENTSPATPLWEPGQPRPPFAYEYQYPVDCLRACWIIPATQTGYAGGVPITTAVTGGAPTLWNGAPIWFKVGIDTFITLSDPVPVLPGAGYAIGDLCTLSEELNSLGQPQGAQPIIRVDTVNGAGGVLTCSVMNVVLDSIPATGGSLFYVYTVAPGVASTTGVGVGATFGGSSPPVIQDQRVILTNQEFATLVYVKQVLDPNVWDPMFQDAFLNALGGDLCLALTGDKALAQMCYAKANQSVIEARKADGNEGLTINDVTPDFIRTRGVSWSDGLYSGPYSAFDWGGMYGPSY